MTDGPATRFRENITGITSMLVTGIWLAAMFTGQSWWLAALLFGYIVVVPIVALLFGDEDDRREWWDDWSSEESWNEWWGGSDSSDGDRGETETEIETESPTDNRDALETLRDRYARGELTDEQFERKLERLLETETLENADEWVRQSRVARERRADGEREQEYEYE